MYLTEKQFLVLQFLKGFRRDRGFSPTLAEIADHFDVSKITIHEHLSSLQEKGAITRQKGRARAIEIPDELEHSPPLTLPLRGFIQAGSPIEAIEQEEVICLADLFAGPRETFLLQVKGDSMIEEQIREGDYVVVERRRTARDGETVVALLPDGEATLKKYFREHDQIRLEPAHPHMQPIRVREVQIQGVVIGVVRRLEGPA